MTDMVNHPPHYTSDPSGVECIQITRHRNFNVGNAIKYLWRAGLKKDGELSDTAKTIEDLYKSIFYIEDEIKRLENTFAITGARISAEHITGASRVFSDAGLRQE